MAGSNGFPRDLIRPGAGAEIYPKGPDAIEYPFQEPAVETHGSNHFHWLIQCFRERAKDGSDRLHEVTPIFVEANNEQEALARAMRIFQRPGYLYRVAEVNEICTKDEALKGE